MNLIYKEINLENQEEYSKFITAWEMAFNRQLDHQIYRWIFNNDNHIFVAMDSGNNEEYMAGYCLLSQSAFLKNKEVKVLLCNNVFVTSRQASKIGVFQAIALHSFSEMNKQGYQVVIGIPNDKAINGHLRANWSQGKNIYFYEISLNSIFQEQYVANNLMVKKLDKNQLTDIQGDFDIFCREFAAKKTFCFIKTVKYFIWRYFENPRNEYNVYLITQNGNIRGYAVTKYYAESRTIHIVDYALETDEELISILKNLKFDYLSAGYPVEFINTWVTSMHLINIFLCVGFYKSDKFNYLIYRDTAGNDMSLGDDYHLTLGDNDVY